MEREREGENERGRERERERETEKIVADKQIWLRFLLSIGWIDQLWVSDGKQNNEWLMVVEWFSLYYIKGNLVWSAIGKTV